MSFAQVYHFKHLVFEHHSYLGPQFLRHKDHEVKDMRHCSGRDWGVFKQWKRLADDEKEQYRIF